ncbi:MAG TPA: winged helix-turn-helix domain-containing protein, partial [Ktedonobacterales bacterium]|nr:winged helix-turn-helix domain-containing protein [Ktedonobacterales bacterium]
MRTLHASAAGMTPASAPEPPLLPAGVPVTMPALPPTLHITTARQFKALSDPTRTKILGIIQNQPATAKQVADRLGLAPGTVGHHLRALESAGVAQVVARRTVRGIIARYYTRTARIFHFDLPPEVEGTASPNVDFLTQARDELAESLAAGGPAGVGITLTGGLPHARLTPERAEYFRQRLTDLMDELMAEPVEEGSMVY